ncbi:hypothetical protein JQX09_07625 [Sulfitobacter pseudonitzschiae]|uniref:Uncharacterized protein n=1 Tax=Pseudosulfitobacter pseudonitzschiae TaxID=1402135 RepID=A0A9Q2NH95_9RHOB|nr:hypothetical protein [Pseudosulfitobacter pseudonitzschiae]MBM2291775.1 hypothetical protein [Pseudosulfitobacter pseudonitzschiae]MBM2296693.1 hypothetical protein [Pseudosulfitobacter pseudonitzschiae]MBM2301606.1 hypothetical protein [Pseudosulfitobacter pseudonitzschiae]MBM2311389.1 hypothetical protein [Pseudosulfitobacter pseudonitzschiae]MBM2316303.1 hypothetical protein [Pseudosulfitobacter pseudonitzschiae]
MSDLSIGGGVRLPEPSRGNRATQVGSTRHFTGGIVLGSGPGFRTGVESHLEAQAALLLAARPEVQDLVEQVRFDWFDEDGEIHKHYIDLVATEHDGTVIGYAVRPLGRVKDTYLAQLARVKEQAVAQGVLDDFRLFTERDVCPVEFFNAKLFHSVRRPDCFGDPVARDVVGRTTGVVTIESLVEQTGLDGMGFRALVRLIRSGHLQKVSYERIDRSCLVFKAKELCA